MKDVKTGDKIEFFYNNKMRKGTVQKVWGERGPQASLNSRVAGFCVDHGDCYKSYRRNGVSFLAAQKS